MNISTTQRVMYIVDRNKLEIMNMLENYRFVQLGSKIDIYLNDVCFMTVNDVTTKNYGEVISLVQTMVEAGKTHYSISFNDLKLKYSQVNRYNYKPIEQSDYPIDKWDNIRPAS